MALIDVEVTYEDGRIESVGAGQREMAAWEREPFGCATTKAKDERPILFFRYLAYAALKRQHRLEVLNGRPPSFDVWSETVDEVEPAGGETEVDPTTPAQSTDG